MPQCSTRPVCRRIPLGDHPTDQKQVQRRRLGRARVADLVCEGSSRLRSPRSSGTIQSLARGPHGSRHCLRCTGSEPMAVRVCPAATEPVRCATVAHPAARALHADGESARSSRLIWGATQGRAVGFELQVSDLHFTPDGSIFVLPSQSSHLLPLLLRERGDTRRIVICASLELLRLLERTRVQIYLPSRDGADEQTSKTNGNSCLVRPERRVALGQDAWR